MTRLDKRDGFDTMGKAVKTTTSGSPSTITPLLARPKSVKSLPATKAFDSFRAGPSHGFAPAIGENGRSYNQQAAAYNTANTLLVRRLRGRHLQMIAIGGSIGQLSRYGVRVTWPIADIERV